MISKIASVSASLAIATLQVSEQENLQESPRKKEGLKQSAGQCKNFIRTSEFKLSLMFHIYM